MSVLTKIEEGLYTYTRTHSNVNRPGNSGVCFCVSHAASSDSSGC
jgi:hypothetical protein